ncbi:MAG TPA: hypothetical protein PKE66_03265 [Pyrinomonadaceae bacterium]|nr:hypothetical protein [Pyrinomonadaceae bacterium]
MRLRWSFGIVAAIFLAVFCLYPQAKMWYARGGEWNGHYAYNDIDEVAYAAYVRALIDGRPRKNDPYTGRDHTAETPQPESLFSIQFAAPYTLAIPARIFGFGAPWAMILSGAVAGFLSALAVFWLLGRMTGSSWFASAGALATFCFGSLAAGEGAILEVLFDGFSYPYFPGFRRYIPAMAFPAFFAMLALLWKVFVEGRPEEKQGDARSGGSRNLILTALAVLAFGYAVFSYFYVWTTAAAFLAAMATAWLAERPEGWRSQIREALVLAGGCGLVLVPYAYLLSQRATTMDHVQLLVHTRLPDLFRFPEYIAFGVLLILIAGMAAGKFRLGERDVLFVFALTLVPFIVFNQQIVTGRALQPIHYQVFIGNYVAVLALLGAIGLFIRRAKSEETVRMKAAWAGLAVAAIAWGFVECHYTVRVLDWANEHRDKGLAVAKRLEEFAKASPDKHRETVLAFDGILADDLPTVAPQNVLWARHQHVFAGLSWQESKERYYQYLYYNGVDAEGLDDLLRRDFVSIISLFGWGRHTDRLNSEYKPITEGEVAEEVRLYREYIVRFDARTAGDPKLSYVVIADDDGNDLRNVTEWYDLSEADRVAGYTIYRATPRAGQ